MSTATSLMTLAEFEALPEKEGVEQYVIRGELREVEKAMTRRSRLHAGTEARVGALLLKWTLQHDPPKFDVLAGEVGVSLTGDPLTAVGIDVAVFDLELLQAQDDTTRMVIGVPKLAVEILSASDQHGAIVEKIDEYLERGVGAVWEVDPSFQTVRVHVLGQNAIMFNRDQTIVQEPWLSGLSIPVADMFPRWT